METKAVVEMFTRTIEAKDNKPLIMDTMDCVVHQLDNHKNCTGCDGELQCSKLATLLMIDATVKSGQADRVGLPTANMAVVELIVDVIRSKDIVEVNNFLPVHLRRTIK